jgi:NADH-quinone oxidoreductase subunit M
MASLAFIILVPLAGAVLARFIPTRSARIVRGLATGCALFSIVGMLIATRSFASYRGGFQPETNWAWIAGARFHLSVDSISLWFGLLAALLTSITVLSPQAENLSLERLRRRVSALLALESGTLGVLVAIDMLVLFLFWELATVGMLLVIGSSSEGRQSRLLEKCLALAQSLAMLGVLLVVYVVVHRATGRWSFDYTTWSSMVLPRTTQFACLGLLSFALFALLGMVATGMRGRISWPGASLILIGLSIELIAFGFLRLALPFFPLACQQAAPLLMGVALAGIVVGSLLANRPAKPEVWAARAWVAQLGFVLAGIVTATAQSAAGAVFQVLAQGVSCAGLYLTVGALHKSGAVGRVRWLKPALVVVFLAAAGVPGLCGFVGEFLIVLGGWRAAGEWRQVQLASLYPRPDIVAAIVALAAAAYAVGFVRMLARLAGSQAGAEMGESRQLLWNERVAFTVVLAAMVGLGLFPGKILKHFAPRVTSVLSSARARAADAQAYPESPVHMFDLRAKQAVGGVLRAFD